MYVYMPMGASMWDLLGSIYHLRLPPRRHISNPCPPPPPWICQVLVASTAFRISGAPIGTPGAPFWKSGAPFGARGNPYGTSWAPFWFSSPPRRRHMANPCPPPPWICRVGSQALNFGPRGLYFRCLGLHFLGPLCFSWTPFQISALH